MVDIKTMALELKKAQRDLEMSSLEERNEALLKVSDELWDKRQEILNMNELDVLNANSKGMKKGLIDRLYLDEERLAGIVDNIHSIVKLDDPIWNSDKVWTRPNGMTIARMSVPIGVIGIIYESRPNVTVDAFSLAIKSGNSILLKGSSSSLNTNIAIIKAIKEGLRSSNISENVVFFIEDERREVADEMMNLTGELDLLIPRGGKDLINYVVENSKVPTLKTGEGNCHIFVDESADFKMAIDIIKNAKLQRVGVCNACETVLIHKDIKDIFLPLLYEEIHDKVELRGCEKTKEIIDVYPADESDWYEEYLDYILAVKVVDDLNDAIDHINKYGTKHSEAIITNDLKNACIFEKRVDSSCVYVNASTRFSDGTEFGFGSEMGISTQKLHARGPVGLEQLVTYKYVVIGNGQIRK